MAAWNTSCTVPARPGAKTMPPRASRRMVSSRIALEKYLAIRPANRFAGSCPYSQVGMASPPRTRPAQVVATLPGHRRAYRCRTVSAAAVYAVVVGEVGRGGQQVDRGRQLVAGRSAR